MEATLQKLLIVHNSSSRKYVNQKKNMCFDCIRSIRQSLETLYFLLFISFLRSSDDLAEDSFIFCEEEDFIKVSTLYVNMNTILLELKKLFESIESNEHLPNREHFFDSSNKNIYYCRCIEIKDVDFQFSIESLKIFQEFLKKEYEAIRGKLKGEFLDITLIKNLKFKIFNSSQERLYKEIADLNKFYYVINNEIKQDSSSETNSISNNDDDDENIEKKKYFALFLKKARCSFTAFSIILEKLSSLMKKKFDISITDNDGPLVKYFKRAKNDNSIYKLNKENHCSEKTSEIFNTVFACEKKFSADIYVCIVISIIYRFSIHDHFLHFSLKNNSLNWFKDGILSNFTTNEELNKILDFCKEFKSILLRDNIRDKLKISFNRICANFKKIESQGGNFWRKPNSFCEKELFDNEPKFIGIFNFFGLNFRRGSCFSDVNDWFKSNLIWLHNKMLSYLNNYERKVENEKMNINIWIGFFSMIVIQKIVIFEKECMICFEAFKEHREILDDVLSQIDCMLRSVTQIISILTGIIKSCDDLLLTIQNANEFNTKSLLVAKIEEIITNADFLSI